MNWLLEERETTALRSALVGLMAKDQHVVPTETLVKLGRDLSGRRLMVDLTGANAIGSPLVVLMQPDQNSGHHLVSTWGLSRRETQVCKLLSQGLRNKDIALRLHLAQSTVKDHVHHILVKSGCSSRAQLAGSFRNLV